MAEAKVGVIIEAEDRASAVLSGVSSQLNTMKSKVKDLEPVFKNMAVAGGVAFGAISTVAITSINAFADAQKTMTIASQSLSNSMDTMTVPALNNLQQKIGEGTDMFEYLKEKMDETGKAAVQLGIDDEDASLAFAKFFAISHDVAQAQRDVKLAMDLSAFSGRSLEESQKAISMAYAGGTKVLKEFGINVKDGADKMSVFEAIQERAGGTAENLANTVEGQTRIMEVQIGNLREAIGGSLAPAITKLLQAVQPLVDKFVTWAENNPDLLAKLLLVAGAIAGIITVVGTLGLLIPTIITGFTFLTTAAGALGSALMFLAANPIGLVIVAIGAVIAAGIYLYTHWDEVSAYAVKTWTAISSTVSAWINRVKETIAAVVGAIKLTWESMWNGVSSFFIGIWDGIMNKIRSAVDFIEQQVKRVQAFIAPISNYVGGAVGGAFNSAKSFLGINDGIVQNGQVITTHPDDYIIATKTPETLGMGGAINININGAIFTEDAARTMGDLILRNLQLQMKH